MLCRGDVLFCVVEFCADKEETLVKKKRLLSFSKRQRRNEAQPLCFSRVQPEGLPPFHILSVPERGILSDEAMGVFAVYRRKLLLPKNIEVPDALKPFLFTPSRYSKERMRHFTEETLGALPKKIRMNAVFIRDKELISAQTLLPHLLKMERVFVLTDSDNRFKELSAEALTRYGAVIYRGRAMPTQNRYDMLIDIDAGVIHTAFGAQSGSVKPRPVSLPKKLDGVLPESCDRDDVAAALFEICGVSLDNE